MQPDLQIVIVEGGWVFVGIVDRDAAPDALVMAVAENVERWGTSEGLGQLAEYGPIAGETRLRRVHRGLRIPLGKVITELSCNPEPWAALIAATADRQAS